MHGKTAADFAANGRHGDSGLRARARKRAGLAAGTQPLREFLLQISCRCSKRPRAEQSWVVFASNSPGPATPSPVARRRLSPAELTKPAGAGSTALPNEIRERAAAMGMLDGRVAICTGSGRGVGGEVAKLMAANGAKIVVNDPGTSGTGEGADTTPAQDIVNQIKAAGGDAVANYGSVASFDDCLAMVGQARESFGGLHIVFNAAGILRDKTFHNMFPEDWQAVIDVHMTGHFNINRAAITLFREQNYGRMIMVSSTSGLLGNIGQANYGSAKFGIVALARIVAMENQSRGITANVIAPSADTRMTRSVPTPKDPEAAAAREERLRRSRADAIAPLCVYLASEGAAHVTGQVFHQRAAELSLYGHMRPLRMVHHNGGWTPELIAEVAMPSLASGFTSLDSRNTHAGMPME